MVKQSVKTTIKPRMALRKTPHNIERGRVSEASFTSSAVESPSLVSLVIYTRS